MSADPGPAAGPLTLTLDSSEVLEKVKPTIDDLQRQIDEAREKGGWRTDWENAPRPTKDSDDHCLFLVRQADGAVTTAYFYWYTESDEGGFGKIACWSLHDYIRDEPLDDCVPVEESSMQWRPMPTGPWAERSTNFEKVAEFNKRFNLPIAGVGAPDFLAEEPFKFRHDFVAEELEEWHSAHQARNMVEVADALGDLLYVVYGAAHFYGIPLDEVFDAIHKKNMTKVRATDPSASKRGTALDVVKPVGFVGPEEDIRAILEAAGYVDE